jgi:hypothetical protein
MTYKTPQIVASYFTGELLDAAIGFGSCTIADGDKKGDNCH